MNLDKEQREAVYSDKNNIVVVAGAGSGKTTVLTERIRHLITEKGADPEEMFAITFTNLATDEMRKRLATVPNTDKMFIGTIHSFANQLMHEFGLYFQILTDEKYLEILNKLIRDYGHYLTVEKAMKYRDMEKAVKECKEPYSILENFFSPEEETEYKLFQRSVIEAERNPNSDYPYSVYSYAKEKNIKTFDDIINIAKSKLGDDFCLEYLFVDEYQDVGLIEDNFIQELKPKHLFIVGDDWQSIYGFKGAEVNIFKRYAQQEKIDPENWGVYRLENNYRCSKAVIEVAEKVISQYSEKIEKKVVCKNVEEQGEFQYYSKGKTNLMKHLLPILKNYKKNYGDWFFLTRNNKELNDLVMLCNSINLPIMKMEKSNKSAENEKILQINKVKAMTIHSVKGLERDNVLLVGDFPIFKAVPEKKKNESEENYKKKMERWEEERRVMYVAVTRPKKKLIIVSESEEDETLSNPLLEMAY